MPDIIVTALVLQVYTGYVDVTISSGCLMHQDTSTSTRAPITICCCFFLSDWLMYPFPPSSFQVSSLQWPLMTICIQSLFSARPPLICFVISSFSSNVIGNCTLCDCLRLASFTPRGVLFFSLSMWKKVPPSSSFHAARCSIAWLPVLLRCHLVMGIYVASSLGPLQIILPWSLSCRSHCGRVLLVFLGRSLAAELVAPVLNACLAFKAATLVCILTSSVWGLWRFHILAILDALCSCDDSSSSRCGLISHCGFHLCFRYSYNITFSCSIGCVVVTQM